MNFLQKTVDGIKDFVGLFQDKVQGVTDTLKNWFDAEGISNFVSNFSPGTSSEASSESSSGTSSESPKDYGLLEYLEGLFSSQGAENEINREYNSAEAALNRQFQSQEARIQRDWYEAMSNSAYQRAVADMKKAGINPILAYQQGGAAVSGTGVASGSAASYNATGGDSISSVLTSLASFINSLKGSSAKTFHLAENVFQTFIKGK